MHERRFVKQGKHAVEVFEEVLEKGQSLLFRRQGLEDTTDENVSEYFRLPILPLRVFLIDSILDRFLKRCVSSLLINPLNTFT
jgi:hypothetical protein